MNSHTRGHRSRKHHDRDKRYRYRDTKQAQAPISAFLTSTIRGADNTAASAPTTNAPSRPFKRTIQEWQELATIARSTKANLLPKDSAIPSSYKDPKSVREALSCPLLGSYWESAIALELDAVFSSGTLKLIPIGTPTKAKGKQIAFKMVLKLKTQESPPRFKARLCALGFLQSPETVGDSYSPTAHGASQFVLSSIAVKRHLALTLGDVETAFLLGSLADPLPGGFVPGLIFPGFRVIICKPLYGLIESPARFDDILTDSLRAAKLEQSLYDRCIWYDLARNIFLCVHIDDLFIVSKPEYPAELKRHLERFPQRSIKLNLSPPDVYLGRVITSSPDGSQLHFSVSHHIEKLVTALGLPLDCSAPTPCPSGDDPWGDRDTLSPTCDPNLPFRSTVGSLMYLSKLRPDVRFTVVKLARQSHRYTKRHMDIAIRTVRYLNSTKHLGVEVSRRGLRNMHLWAESDSDWLGDLKNRRSTMGNAVYLGDVLIDCNSNLDKSVSLSTAEAEYRALSETVRLVLYYSHLLSELGVDHPVPVVYTDSQNVLDVLCDPHRQVPASTRHVEARVHFVRTAVASNHVRLAKRDTKDLGADLLTKNLSKAEHWAKISKFPSFKDMPSDPAPVLRSVVGLPKPADASEADDQDETKDNPS